MRKLLAIAWRELYTRFTDRTLFIILLLAPLGISSIVGLAFGGLDSGASPVEHIPVAVINQDEGAQGVGALGASVSRLLVEGQLPAEQQESLSRCASESVEGAPPGPSLETLIDGEILDHGLAAELVAAGEIEAPASTGGGSGYLLEAGRAAVDIGRFTVLVVIPPDFTRSMTELAHPGLAPGSVKMELYANRGRRLAAGIVHSVVEGVTSQMASGNIAIGVTLNELAARSPAALPGMDSEELGTRFACAFSPGGETVSLDIRPVQSAAQENPAGGILVAVGSAQGMFFALFTGQFGILSLYQERKNWTLQRLIASPTPRWAILGGKLVGVMASILFQLIVLGLALTLVGGLMAGRLLFIWGENFALLACLLLAVATAVGGLGMMLAGILRSIEQANIVVSVLNIALGVLGGTFGFSLPVQVAGISLIHWGREAFQLLAAGQTDVDLHLAVLFGQGALLFTLGLIIFNRRFEVA